MTDQPYENPTTPPPAQPAAPKRKGMSPMVQATIGFIAMPSILVALIELSEASRSIWTALLPIAFLIAIPAGLFFRPTNHFSGGALIFMGGVQLALLIIRGIHHL